MLIDRAAVEMVIAHAREEAPDECCGLLVGSAARIEEAHRANNLEASPSRFLINPQEGPAGRSGGSLSWAGLANTYFWVDPSRKVAGVIMTQVLPFADPRVLGLYGKFESGLYKALS